MQAHSQGLNCTKIEHWSRAFSNINKMAYFYAHVQCVLLFLVPAEILPGVEFHIVTHSYSSRLFLCALADAMVLFVRV